MVPPSNVTAREGSRVKLTCQAEGYPNNITYRWYRDGVDVALLQQTASAVVGPPSSSAGVSAGGSQGSRAAIYADGSLVLSGVRAEDAGWYTCRPTNGLGQPPDASAYLNVQCKCVCGATFGME